MITILKYGTAVLTKIDPKGISTINHNLIAAHGNIISQFEDSVLVITSGAVGTGKAMIEEQKLQDLDPILVKRLLAELGQPKLMDVWRKAIAPKPVLQKLVTYEDLERPTMFSTLSAAFDKKFCYIVNFNDGVDDAELQENQCHQFGDNDHLASEIAQVCLSIDAEVRLIFNTSAPGIINKNTGKVFESLFLDQIDDVFLQTHCEGLSCGGTGGMYSKLQQIRAALTAGVKEVWVVNGKDPTQLQAVLNGGKAGTKITRKS